jgi:predicted lactoylglutathione lyase
MPRLIFVNLPVADLARSTAFYEVVGFTRNPQFSDDTAACMVLSDVISVMLLTHDKFRMFTPKDISDAHRTSEVLLCVSCDSREAVDEMTENALAAGGREPNAKQDYGMMYGRSFEDPDGHIWEPMWMDVSALGDRPAGEVVAEQCA